MSLRSRHRPRAAAFAMAAIAFVPACGSTVQMEPSGAEAARAESEPSLPPGATTAEPGARPVEEDVDAGGPAVADGGASSGASSAASGQAGGGVAGRRPPAHVAVSGVTPTTIHVGVAYADTSGGTAFVLGQNVTQGDVRGMVQALTSSINRRGGLAGRRVVPVVYPQDYARSVANLSAENEARCAFFTEDHPVLAVIETAFTTSESVACLARRRVATLSDYYTQDSVEFRRFADFYYSPASLPRDVAAATTADAYAAELRHSTPGLFRGADAASARSEGVLRAALRRHGAKLDDVFVTAETDFAKQSSDAGAAVLRFRTAGVTDVFFLDFAGFGALSFMEHAQNQQYYPHYLINDTHNPAVLAGLAPTAQLANARLLSWAGGFSLWPATPPTPPSSQARCREIMTKAGVKADPLEIAYTLCSAFFLLEQSLGTGTVRRPVSLRHGIEAIGRARNPLPLNYATLFGSGRHYGAVLTRRISFNVDCRCFRYVGPGPSAP